MNTRPIGPFCRLTLLGLLAAAPTPARTVQLAATTARGLHARLGDAWSPLMHAAKAVLIAPAGTDAVLLLHGRDGWGEPAFFAPPAPHGNASVLLIMSERALDAVLRQRGLSLAGPDAFTVASLGTRIHAGGELLLWSTNRSSRLDPSGPRQDDAANAAWYGYPRSAAEIVGATPPSPRTLSLRRSLASS